MGAAADTITRAVTSWEGVTARRAATGDGVIEFRLGRHVLGFLPVPGRVDERTVIARMRAAYEQAQDALDRRAGVLA